MIVLVQKQVDNPYLTDGLNHGEDASRHRYVSATVNAVTTLGALAYLPVADERKGADQPGKRFPHHDLAASLFKSRYEALYGGIGGAVDPSREPVDISTQAHDSGMAARLDKSAKLAQVIPALGKPVWDELVDMLVLCTPSAAYADLMPSGQPNQRQVRAKNAERLAALDSLSILWELQSRSVDRRNVVGL